MDALLNPDAVRVLTEKPVLQDRRRLEREHWRDRPGTASKQYKRRKKEPKESSS